MMYEYIVKYLTKDNQVAGLRVFAYSAFEAEAQAQSMSNYQIMLGIPERIDK